MPWVKGTFYVECQKDTTVWYRFRDEFRSYANGMYMKKDSTNTINNIGDVPPC